MYFHFFSKKTKTQTNRNKVKNSHIPTTYPFLLLLNLRDWKARIFPTILDLKSLLNHYNYTTNCPQVQENYLIGKGKTCTKYFSKYLLKMWNIAVITWNLTMIITEIEFVEKKTTLNSKKQSGWNFATSFFVIFFHCDLLVCFSIISKYASTLFNAQRWHGIIDIIYFLSN